MDTSPKYIKMCEKAEELQKMYLIGEYPHDETIKDFLACKKHKSLIVWTGDQFDCGLFGADKNYVIWLPRQDQLQAIILEKHPTWDWLHLLSQACCSGSVIPCGWIDSGEKYWFAFAMREKYHKVWDTQKEEWCPINPT